MIFAIQSILVVGLFALSLMTLMMVRQVGVLSRRLGEKLGKSAQRLENGTPAPLLEFASVTGSGTYKIPTMGSGDTGLLFISFSCPMCQQVLSGLASLKTDLKCRLLVFFLDGNVMLGYGKEIVELRNAGVQVALGEDVSDVFAISRAPFVYIVDATGKIKGGAGVMTPADLVSVMERVG